MGTGVILLVYCMSPIIYAEYLVRYESVANAVAKTVAKFNNKQQEKQKDTKDCDLKEGFQPDYHEDPEWKEVPKFNLTEVRCRLVWIDKRTVMEQRTASEQIPRRLKFWNELVPELLHWLSAEAIECIIYSQYKLQTYLYIRASRSDWINLLQKLVYSLSKLISVVHNKTVFDSTSGWLQALTSHEHLDWGKNWLAAYESWYTAHEYRDKFQEYPGPLQYLQTVILNCFESVMGWLAAHTKREHYEAGYTYVPKSPRRPIIMVWPSVMNPAVNEALVKELEMRYKAEEYLKIECDYEVGDVISEITSSEVRNAVSKVYKEPTFVSKAPTFFRECVVQLIIWLSRQALQCGFYTIYKRERHEIYRFIAVNRDLWIKALEEVVMILLKTIAVIHRKKSLFSAGPVYGYLNWLENWAEAYEQWYKNYPLWLKDHPNYPNHPDPQKYLETFVTNSLDIVIAWLFDYLGERTRTSKTPKWQLSDDRNIKCALENYDMVPALGWNFLLDGVNDQMKVMADTFLECKVKKGCEYRGPLDIVFGVQGRDQIVRIPDTKDCRLTCNGLPNVKDSISKYAYGHAYMTTAVGHELNCNITSASNYWNDDDKQNEVRTFCYPLIVDAYVTDRQYKTCKADRCKLPCCKPLRPSTQPHCEIVTNKIWEPDYQVISSTTITKDMSKFPDLQSF